MTKTFKKSKKNVVNYSSPFPFQAIFRTISWTLFLPLFYFLGKNCLESDILGKIYHFILKRKIDFCQYFLGENVVEKSRLLTYSIYFIVAIIILNIFSILIN
jgi:hypothetical protein